MSNPSPLRYPGGKYRLYRYINEILDTKKMHNTVYVEPFCGGAAVGLSLLINNDVKKIILNDYDRAIYSFWYAVLNYTEQLCEMIRNKPITIEEWFIQREIQKNKDEKDILKLGFSTLFLNRTNRSGIIKAGVIGGMSQQGLYKLDCRFNKEKLIEKIKKISEFKDRIELYNLDTNIFIDRILKLAKQKYFMFFDPPYYDKGSSLYTNFYTHYDHYNLANKIKSIKKHSWILTYDNKEEIIKMYKTFKHKEYSLNYSVQKKYKGKEVMFYSRTLNKKNIFDIKLPE